VCRLFSSDSTYAGRISSGGHAAPDRAFTVDGYKNWKAALEKGKGFERHKDSTAHRHALTAYNNFFSEKSVDIQIDSHHKAVLTAKQRQIAANRSAVANIFRVVLYLSKLCLPFRGHSDKCGKKGLVVELIHYLAENDNIVLKQHLSTAPRNATYLGHRSQNEMITIIGNSIKAEILRQVREAKIFCFMVDETRDLAHLDQLIIVARYIKKGATVIQERLIGLLNVHKKREKLWKTLFSPF